MKKVSKILALLMAACMLFSLVAMSAGATATAVPNSNYKRPEVTAYKVTERPKIDGNANDATWKQALEITFTKKALADGSGQLWSYTEDSLLWEDMPEDIGGDGKAYLGWDEDYFYFALVIDDAENVNNESQGVNLWKGDCLQMQIGPDMTPQGLAKRYEFGFALSQFGGTRRLGYQWFPLEDDLKQGGKQDMKNASANADYYYYVDRKGTTTTYEVALKYSQFGREAQMKAGDQIPFSFALHLYCETPDKFLLNPDDFNGYFMEWAKGVVGGAEGKMLTEGATVTLGGTKGGKEEPTTPPVQTTTPPTTTAPITNPGTPTTTKPPVTDPGTPTTTVATPDPSQGGETTTTEAPTTTTTEPPVVDGTVFYVEENATDVDDADTIDAIKADFPDDEIAIKKFVATEKKFGIGQDFLKGVYVKDADGKFVALEGAVEEIEAEDGSVSEWMMYEVEKDAELYIVKMVPPTTTTAEPTTTTEAQVETTTKAPETDNDNEANTTPDDDKTEEGGFPIWIIIVAVVVVAAAVVAFIVLKKKKGAVEE